MFRIVRKRVSRSAAFASWKISATTRRRNTKSAHRKAAPCAVAATAMNAFRSRVQGPRSLLDQSADVTTILLSTRPAATGQIVTIANAKRNSSLANNVRLEVSLIS